MVQSKYRNLFCFATGPHHVILIGLELTEICLTLPSVGMKGVCYHNAFVLFFCSTVAQTMDCTCATTKLHSQPFY